MKVIINATITSTDGQLDWMKPTEPATFDARLHYPSEGIYVDAFDCVADEVEPTCPEEVAMSFEPASTAMFSTCEQYRYHLYRRVADTGGGVCFIMLNPSTAGGKDNDPTVRRDIGYARSWGKGRLDIVNMFAYRTTHPAELRQAAADGIDIVGPRNDRTIVGFAKEADFVICAWGVNGGLQGRDKAVLELLREAGVTPLVLRMTKGGLPAHPLYLPADLMPQPWVRP